MIEGCDRPAPTVRMGAVAISLCIEHQDVYDKAWLAALAVDRSGGRTSAV